MTTYSVPIEITPESEGGLSVVCLTLPGCVSQGETVDESVANIREAFVGLVEGYQAHGQEIPWRPLTPTPKPIRKHLVIEVK